MNKCYRMVFNRRNSVWQAVAENASGHSGGGYKLLLAAVLVVALPVAQAQVTGPGGANRITRARSRSKYLWGGHQC